MTSYLTELTIVHLTLMLIYMIFLRHETEYKMLRLYLISAGLLSILVPFVHFPENMTFSNPEIIYNSAQLPAIWLAPNVQNSVIEYEFWSFATLIWIYAFVSMILCTRLLLALISISSIIKKSQTTLIQNRKILVSSEISGSFSFWRWVVLSSNDLKMEEEIAAILLHENAHVKLRHSLDILFVELFKICFWWLPSSWILSKEIRRIHEFQADAIVAESIGTTNYSKIIINRTLNLREMKLTSSFHGGMTLNRINAMKKNIAKINPGKAAMIGLVSLLLIIGFACNEELDADIRKLGQQSQNITFDQLPPQMQKTLEADQDKLTFVKISITESELNQMQSGQLDFNSIEQLKDLDPNLIHMMEVQKDQNEIFMAIKKEGANFDYLANTSKSEDEVFTIVENPPSFPGGMTAFYKYIAENMNYPTEARLKGVEGRVYIQFVVDKDGAIIDVKSVKGIGNGCDEEAIRVMNTAPKFEPGTQRDQPVKVRMVLPIIFKLDQIHKQPDQSGSGIIVIDDVENNKPKLKLNDLNGKDGIVSGTVTNSETGEPVPNASVLEIGTNNGTHTNENGEFTLKLRTPESSGLIISHISFEACHIRSIEATE